MLALCSYSSPEGTKLHFLSDNLHSELQQSFLNMTSKATKLFVVVSDAVLEIFKVRKMRGRSFGLK